MDVVTHAMIGLIGASPFAVSHPVAASCFALGAVAPDLDALSRLFGKRAFMRAHQTFTHSIPFIAFAGAALGLALWAVGVGSPGLAALGLALGMLSHTLTDLTNTYGIALWEPFSKRRYCTEWLFFVDSVVIVSSVAALGAVFARWSLPGGPGWGVAAVYFPAMALYWTARGLLRGRALRLAPDGTRHLLPRAFVPWRYDGYGRSGERVFVFAIDGLTGEVEDRREVPVHDREWAERLRAVPEFAIMRALSPGYHVVAVDRREDRTAVRCRDLRTRCFGGRFGELELVVDAAGEVVEKVFHV